MITNEHYQELDQLLKKCLEHDNALSEWENDFVSDFVDRLEKYQEKINVSSKQQAIFDRIEKKLQDAGLI